MILIGQDALGAWAWIILDRAGHRVTSGDCLPDRFLAAEVAVAVYRGIVKRGEADLEPAPRVTFPDDEAA